MDTSTTATSKAAWQTTLLLRIGFTVAPILAGLDKFFNWMVDWPDYLAPWMDDLLPGTAQQFMYAVGGVEIVAGVLVAVAPWIGGYVVAAWLAGIIGNLLTANPPQYYDIALRDIGLMLAAVGLGRLAWAARADEHGDARIAGRGHTGNGTAPATTRRTAGQRQTTTTR